MILSGIEDHGLGLYFDQVQGINLCKEKWIRNKQTRQGYAKVSIQKHIKNA